MARKILLADDSVTAQNMGRKILADAGYEVIAVNNGSAALKKIAETKPDIIILDVYMPGYSGLEVCQRLKEAQETARVPVLLTVGKLEPFKPEEARRVRAEGYIVKPFEASELLSALSKLEDKIVPRAEPSKPGRFARANAAIDQGIRNEGSRDGRYDKSVAMDEDTGWKDRIGFPSKEKKAPETAENDDSTIYNAVNKDLRTVVDRKLIQESQDAQAAAEGEDVRVDLGALAPEGLPKDVTPEEIAALAAAAAQMKGKLADAASAVSPVVPGAPAAGETPIQEATVVERNPADTQSVADAQAAEPAKKELQTAQTAPDDSTVATAAFAAQELEGRREGSSHGSLHQPLPAMGSPSPSEMMAAIAGLIPEIGEEAGGDSGKDLAEDATHDPHHQDPHNLRRRASDCAGVEPATMAAAAGVALGGSTVRWTAVAMEVAADEASISLEHEMQKAHGALAGAEVAHVRFAATPQLQPEAAPPTAVAAEPIPEPPVSAPAVLAEPALAGQVSAESGSAASDLGEAAYPANTSSASGRETGEAFETAIPAGPEASAGAEPLDNDPPAAASEAITPTVKEFEKVGAATFSSQPDVSEDHEVAVAQTAEIASTATSETLSGDAVPSLGAKPQGMEEAVSRTHDAGAETTTVVLAKEDTPELAPQQPESDGQSRDDVSAEIRQADEPAQFVPGDLKTTETVTVAASAADESVAHSGDTRDDNSPEGMSKAAELALPGASFDATTLAASRELAMGGAKDMTKKESEISETTAAAWANWRRIRESGNGKVENKSATAPSAAAKAHDAEPVPVNSSEEKDSAQAESAMAVAAGAEAAPEESSDDSGEIANIVDSVLAQMRPKIVEEISRKLGKKK